VLVELYQQWLFEAEPVTPRAMLKLAAWRSARRSRRKH
jgi:hypothetical protein